MRPRCRRSSTIMPAHVPKTGPAKVRNASSNPYRRISRMKVVDSPPGTTSPSSPSSCSGLRTSTTSAPRRRSIAACSRTLPWTARTPTRMPELPAAGFEQLFRAQRGGGETAHCVAEPARDAPEDLGVVEVRGRLDDRLRAVARIARLEDSGADEDAVGAKLHAERSVCGRRDPTRCERHDRQPPVLGDPAHELDRRLEVLRLGIELVGIHRSQLL